MESNTATNEKTIMGVPQKDFLHVLRINWLPASMFLLGIWVAISAFFPESLIFYATYIFVILLFVVLPVCTRTRIRDRMIFTAIPGIILVMALVMFILSGYDMLMRIPIGIYGVIGAWYFRLDYMAQYKIHAGIVNKAKRPKKITQLQKVDVVQNVYLISKCSRQAYLNTMSKLITKEEMLVLRKDVAKVQKWYHFFPSSDKPLLANLFPVQYNAAVAKVRSWGLKLKGF